MEQKEKFSSQADASILAAVREIAAKEGRQFQALLDEALQDLIAKRNGTQARPELIEAFDASMQEFDSLYRKLAE